MPSATVSLRDDDSRRGRVAMDLLVFAMCTSRLHDPPFVVPLEGIDEVSIGRGDERRVVVESKGRLRVELPDAAASTSHARLERSPGGAAWQLADAGSKNGTLVNGARIDRQVITGADLLEVGGTFFLLRHAAHDDSRRAPAGLQTLSGPLVTVFDALGRVARSTVPVLVLGDTGTGKERIARAVHEISGRSGAFVAVNCGALPATLVESELFGSRRGAFSGAEDRPGMVRSADGGTLFLDEIGELPEPSQAALLRVLQEGEVQPLGASRPIKVDVRLVAATNQQLAERVAAGRFRRDLYARVRGYVLTLPPLRERREDLGVICAEILRKLRGDRAAGITLQRAAARALFLYDWPLNIRELEQALAAALAVGETSEIRLDDLPADLRGAVQQTLSTAPAIAATDVVGGAELPASAPGGEGDAPPAMERERIVAALEACAGNQTRAAKLLGISRATLVNKLGIHRLRRPRK